MVWTIAETLKAYGRLHDGLSDMIEGGRLDEGAIPDDYRWLVETLSKLGAPDVISTSLEANAARDKRLERAIELLSETLSKWEDEEDSVQEEKAEHIEELNEFFSSIEKGDL